ncbi:hypothetical protein F0562_029362 [Nyssa sinensis]|uniref:Transcription factor CBF/NF-Y/archaeal histone domain-containing protein n=1 Tax=Nyssa sinensis TaxID=561372 RepID=A0A5J5B2S6_9ASTE|nr:hypothetical protein F0562_029362 [Nyssa sinensis]
MGRLCCGLVVVLASGGGGGGDSVIYHNVGSAIHDLGYSILPANHFQPNVKNGPARSWTATDHRHSWKCSSIAIWSKPPTGAQLAQHQLANQHIHQQQQQLQQQVQSFWANQYQEIEKVTDFKNQSLPLARIKKIMKADEDVRMISAEAPIVFARACEMFISELTLRSWNHSEENKRRTLQKNDIAAAITRTDIFDFLVDIVPREDLKDEAFATMPVGGPADTLPYYYMPAQHSPQAGTPGMMMGTPVMDPALYAQQPYPYMAQQMWPQAAQRPHSPSDS